MKYIWNTCESFLTPLLNENRVLSWIDLGIDIYIYFTSCKKSNIEYYVIVVKLKAEIYHVSIRIYG